MMKPYMVIEGTSGALEMFEQKVTKALEMGYTLAGELIAQTFGASEVKFYQPVIISEDDDEDFDDDDMDDEDDE